MPEKKLLTDAQGKPKKMERLEKNTILKIYNNFVNQKDFNAKKRGSPSKIYIYHEFQRRLKLKKF